MCVHIPGPGFIKATHLPSTPHLTPRHQHTHVHPPGHTSATFERLPSSHCSCRQDDAVQATVFLEVASTNAAGLALYRSLGFACLGRRKSYYQGPEGPADAIMMSCPVQVCTSHTYTLDAHPDNDRHRALVHSCHLKL